jgi:hypothetical protein
MTKGEEKRTERFSMRLPATIHARLVKAANADHRSMADVALIAIETYLDALDVGQASRTETLAAHPGATRPGG